MDPPVPRPLVSQIQVPPSLSPEYTESGRNVSATGLAGEFRKIRAGSQTSLRFCRLPVRPQVWLGLTYTGRHLQCWLEEDKVLQGQSLHPIKHALQIFTDDIKRRVERSLKPAHCKRNPVPSRKQTAYKLYGTKSSLSSLKKSFRTSIQISGKIVHVATDNTSGVIHKQGRRHEVGPTL